MEQLKYFLLLLLLPLLAAAGSVHWLGDYNTALRSAHKQHKPLLVLLVKKNDTASATIIRDNFMNQTYIKQINQKTIPVIIVYEGRSSYPVEMYYTTIFPTLFFIDSQKELFLREPLYREEINTKVLSEIMKAL